MVVMQHSRPLPLSVTRPLVLLPQTRLPLPSRHVDAETIEDAYVQFVLACNPAVPLDSNTSVLREAFQAPPKSGGKSFSTWTLFQLIVQFQSKQIKTWGDLALKLGVQPPDQERGESSQKIQQYAVRLKRWMHSMHIDAFFEYLLHNPHPYWTEIPVTTNPVTEGGRDGVAAEDDMALRSLLPHIRPRRGRKRPDERVKNSGRSPSSQRARSAEHQQHHQQQQQLDFWAAPHTDTGSNDFLFPPHDHFSNISMDHTGMSPWIQPEDFANTTLSTQSYTGVATPIHDTSANMLWSEQQSHHIPAEELQLPAAVTSSSTTTTSKKSKRHGAKVVSSAWRAGGPGGSGKTRGRPPMKRQNTSHGQLEEAENMSPFSAFQTLPGQMSSSSPPSTMGHNKPQMPTAMMAVGSSNSLPATTITTTTTVPTNTELSLFGMHLEAQQQHDQDQRQVPSQLPLQVPERMEDEVIFAPHGLVAPEMHMMDPFAARSLSDIEPFEQVQQQQLEHDLRFQTRPQDAAVTTRPPFQRTFSRPKEMSNLGPTLPPHHLEQQQQQQAPPPVHPAAVRQDNNTVPTSRTSAFSGVTYQDTTDRTNLDTIESLLAHALLSAPWHDSRGTAIPACGVDEAVAISSGLIETARKGATSREAFVSNISTLAGTTILKNPERHTVRVYRVESTNGEGGTGGEELEEEEFRVYDIHWDLRLGDVCGGFHLREKVNWEKWKDETRKRNRARGDYRSSQQQAPRDPERREEDEDTDQDADSDSEEERGRGLDEPEGDDSDGDAEDEAAWWRSKYQGLLGVVQEQNAEISELRRRGILRNLHARPGPGPR